MKRWSSTFGQPARARDTLRRVGPVLMGVAMAGAVSLPIPSQSKEILGPLRTSGTVIEAWAFGTLSDARQPKSQEACDLEHVCKLAISSAGGAGTGTGATIKSFFASPPQGELPPNLPFTLTETIDYAHPVTKGVQGNSHGACYPVSGVMEIAVDASILVLDIVGQACQVGRDAAQVVLTGSYVSDSASNGDFVNPDAIGTVNINNPSGLADTGSTMKASLVGQLKYGG
jgi:hypothetical protein